MILITALSLFFAPPAPSNLALATERIIGIADTPSERLNPPHWIAPGAPPVLSFRYFDASDRGRFGNLGLMTDDAGH